MRHSMKNGFLQTYGHLTWNQCSKKRLANPSGPEPDKHFNTRKILLALPPMCKNFGRFMFKKRKFCLICNQKCWWGFCIVFDTNLSFGTNFHNFSSLHSRHDVSCSNHTDFQGKEKVGSKTDYSIFSEGKGYC